MSTLKLENIKHPDSASNNISVDSSGRVGIGTTSPTKTLHIYGNSENNHQIRLENTFGTGSDWTLNAYGANGNFYIGNNLDRVVIDSAGRVTMPYQPSFFAYYSSGFSVPAYNSNIVYDTIEHNTGGHYSTSTGRFTAPVTGIYRFVHKLNTPVNDTIEAKLNKNGTEVCRSYTIASTQNKTIYAVMSMSLNANDYITAGTYNPSASSVSHYGGIVQSQFSGYLLG